MILCTLATSTYDYTYWKLGMPVTGLVSMTFVSYWVINSPNCLVRLSNSRYSQQTPRQQHSEMLLVNRIFDVM